MLNYKSAEECAYDALSLGEIMLRLDPADGRIHTTRRFDVWEGGGEYNVVRGLRRCFGLRTATVTAFADNPVERGFGIRGAKSCSDRGNTAVSQLKPGDIDWDEIFGKYGVRHFHTGGIFAALGENTPEVAIEALRKAKEYGTITSYDLNYRPSLWKSIGGTERAREVNREIAKYVDVMIGNEEDFTACLGLEIEGVDSNLTNLETESFKAMIRAAVAAYPNFKVVATTMRSVKTATVNDWGAIAYGDGKFAEAIHRPGLEIFDRVGGGDSFASGMIYGLMTDGSIDFAVNCGAAHGALAMTTPGDTSMATWPEVKKLMQGGGARVDR